ncbi:soluble lytic murein transglycosylase-like protein [Clostridiales Family XIII bacterium PM5-7]
MAKKLIIMLLSITMIACSSISIYATNIIDTDNIDTTTTTTETDEEKAAAEKEAEEKEAAEKEAAEKEAAKKAAAKKKAEKYKKGLAAYIRKINPNVSKTKSLNMAGEFIAKGKKFNLDAKVLMAIAQNESTFYTNATSPYGYKGLMQTSDALARKYGYKPSSLYKANVSIYVGARYLRTMKNTFKTYKKALSAYAYGSGAVKSGNFSYGIANKMLDTRDDITKFLERNNYI